MLIKGRFYEGKVVNKEEKINFCVVGRNMISINGQKHRVNATQIPNRYSVWLEIQKSKGVSLKKEIFFDIIKK